MIPAGAEPWDSANWKEITIPFEVEGVYGYRCESSMSCRSAVEDHGEALELGVAEVSPKTKNGTSGREREQAPSVASPSL